MATDHASAKDPSPKNAAERPPAPLRAGIAQVHRCEERWCWKLGSIRQSLKAERHEHFLRELRHSRCRLLLPFEPAVVDSETMTIVRSDLTRLQMRRSHQARASVVRISAEVDHPFRVKPITCFA